MRKMSLLLLCFSQIAVSGVLFSQNAHLVSSDTIILMNGTKFTATILDSSLYGARVSVPSKKKKTKEVIIEGDRIFSLKFSNGREKILYKQDSTVGNDLTVEETRFFIQGERDAAKGFKPTGSNIGAFCVSGAAAAVAPVFLSPVVPFAYAGILLIPKVKIKHKTVSNIDNLNHVSYLMGYERVARKKKGLQAFVAGAIGASIGLTVNYFVNK